MQIQYATFKNNYWQSNIYSNVHVSLNKEMIFERYETISLSNECAEVISKNLEKVKISLLQNTGPLISISLNNKSCYCYLPRSTKDSNQFAYAGPEWPCIL